MTVQPDSPAVNLLKGKKLYKPVNIITSIEQVPPPPNILKTHPLEDLDIDFLYVQSTAYLFIKSTKIKFHATRAFNHISKHNKKTTHPTYKRGPNDIINGIENVLTDFDYCCFQVNLIGVSKLILSTLTTNSRNLKVVKLQHMS